MPELPEVETVRTQIHHQLPLVIEDEYRSKEIHSLLRKAKSPEAFSPVGKILTSARRHGKVLILDFEQAGTLLVGLGMSGGWRLSHQLIQEKHTHLQWKARNQKGATIYLGYVDPRRFGSLAFLTKQEAETRLAKIGVDVSSPEFNLNYLNQVIKRHPERQIKPFLLEQKYFAGVGNYIACEMCAHAGIRPTRRLKTLTQNERALLIASTPKVLQGSTEAGGMTFSGGYKDTSGSDGGGLAHLVVFYQKVCQLCRQTPVKKIVLAARGTYYCPNCQR